MGLCLFGVFLRGESLKEPVRSMLAENYGVQSESFGQQLADVAGKLVQS